MNGPLRGLRVLELATGVAGPYAGRLLSMLGATVIKVEPSGGDRSRVTPIDGGPQQEPSPEFVHLNTGKRLVDSEGVNLAAALRWADVVLDDGGFGSLPATGGATVITVHPGGEHDEELPIQAASGLLAVSTDDDGRPLRFPGHQAGYFAGGYAAVAALAALATGARRAEVDTVAALRSAFESHVAADLYTATAPDPADPGENRRNAGHLARTFPSGVMECADGYVIPGTVRAEDWIRQCEVYGRPELVYDKRFVWAHRWDNRDELAALLRDWYLAHDRRGIFAKALEAGWAAAMVMTGRDALADPHLEERGFLVPVRGATTATVIGRPWRSHHLDVRTGQDTATRLAFPGEDGPWFDPQHPRPSDPPRPPHPRRLRVVELTLAWAGPLAGRMLGELGADVVRVEFGGRPDGWRSRHRWEELGVPVPPGVDPQDCTWDASAQFNSLNRAKRAVSVDLTSAAGAQVFRDLVGVADVLIVNMGHDVLDKRGLTGFVRERVELGLVVITMPALGITGPHRSMAGYGMLLEGMGGFAARYGLPQRPRASVTYCPDAIAGVHGVLAVLASLAARDRDGRGDWIDLSQQETTWLHFGDAIVLASREGRDPCRVGNGEPGAAASGIIEASGGFVAYVDRRGVLQASPEPLPGATDSVADTVMRLRAMGVAAQEVRSIPELFSSGELAAGEHVRVIDHPVAGPRAYLTSPIRLDGAALACDTPAPCFDEHTDEVLTGWLGLDPQRVSQLRGEGAVGTRPKQPRRRAPRAQAHPSPVAQ